MEPTIGTYDRYLATVHHHPRTGFRLARHLDDVAMLNEGINVQSDSFRVLTFGNDSKPVFLAFHGFFSGGVLGQHQPVVGALPEARDHHVRGLDRTVDNSRGEIWILGD